MRIAVRIIGLVVGLLVMLQSCAVSTGGALADNKAFSEGGSVGLLVALLYILGGAFAFGLPLVAVACFALAGLLGLMVGMQGVFQDMTVWGIGALILALLAFFSRTRKAQPPRLPPA